MLSLNSSTILQYAYLITVNLFSELNGDRRAAMVFCALEVGPGTSIRNMLQGIFEEITSNFFQQSMHVYQ